LSPQVIEINTRKFMREKVRKMSFLELMYCYVVVLAGYIKTLQYQGVFFTIQLLVSTKGNRNGNLTINQLIYLFILFYTLLSSH
jgi:hypothetical protein